MKSPLHTLSGPGGAVRVRVRLVLFSPAIYGKPSSGLPVIQDLLRSIHTRRLGNNTLPHLGAFVTT